MPRLSWQILKRMNYLPWVGLPNILAERFVVPEFLQNEATPERIASTIMDIMTDKSKLDDIRAEFTMMHETLKQDNAKKAARAILASIQ
jgi:lipid-A-disaccharide synthase